MKKTFCPAKLLGAQFDSIDNLKYLYSTDTKNVFLWESFAHVLVGSND